MELGRTTRKLALATAVALTSFTACAEVYPYACKVKDDRGNTHLYAVVLDTGKRTITWNGQVFRNLKEVDDCKANYTARDRNGVEVELCIATQGVATLTYERVTEYECDYINDIKGRLR
jgi:hypothetical protein